MAILTNSCFFWRLRCYISKIISSKKIIKSLPSKSFAKNGILLLEAPTWFHTKYGPVKAKYCPSHAVMAGEGEAGTPVSKATQELGDDD